MFQPQNPPAPRQPSKMFKVLCPIEKKGGGTYWARCGTAYENRDDSINCYLDFFPKDWKFQIRELDAEDIRRMNERRASSPSPSSSGPRNDAWRTATAPYARGSFGSSHNSFSSSPPRDLPRDLPLDLPRDLPLDPSLDQRMDGEDGDGDLEADASHLASSGSISGRTQHGDHPPF